MAVVKRSGSSSLRRMPTDQYFSDDSETQETSRRVETIGVLWTCCKARQYELIETECSTLEAIVGA